MYSREGFEEKKGKLVTACGIENSTTNDASGFFVAVGCVRCMDVPGRNFRHPGDRMNSVNKKCALQLGAPAHIERANTDVFNVLTNTNTRPFPFCFLPPVCTNVARRAYSVKRHLQSVVLPLTCSSTLVLIRNTTQFRKFDEIEWI